MIVLFFDLLLIDGAIILLFGIEFDDLDTDTPLNLEFEEL